MAFKKNKAKMIGVVTSIAAASLVSVGFASWSIANSKKDSVENTINVNAGVSRNILDFQKKSASSQTFTFGKSSGSAISGAWLKTEYANVDNLGPYTFTWDYEVRHGYTPTGTATINTGTGASEGNLKWKAAVDAEYVQVVNLDADIGTPTPKDDDTDKGVLTVTLQLGWGTHFEGSNPYVYYNTEKEQDDYVSGNSGPTWADDAITALNSTALKNLDGITLTIDVTLS